MIKEQQKLIEELKTEIKTSKPPEQPIVAQPKETMPPAGQEPPKPSLIEKAKEVLLPKEGEPKRDILSYQGWSYTAPVDFLDMFAAGTRRQQMTNSGP
jgi:hypothetical protein